MLNAILEFLYEVQHRDVLAVYYRFLQTQWWPIQRMREFQSKKLLKLIHHAYNKVPYYRKIMDDSAVRPGDLRYPEDLKKLPVTTKDAVREAFLSGAAVSSNLSDHGAKIARTSGSTGKTLHLFRSRQAQVVTSALQHRFLNWAGFDEKELLPSTARFWGRPSHLSWHDNAWKSVRRKLRNTYELNTHGWSVHDYQECAKLLQRMNPGLLRGYAFALNLLAQTILAQGITDIRPRAIITTAQTLFPDYRDAINKAFNTLLYDQYGGAECEMIACECENHECYHIQDEHVVVELLEDNGIPEAYKKIIVTDLDNYAQPFIRYEIGDLAEPMKGRCSCGRVLFGLKSIAGRIQELVRTRDGRFFSGHAFNSLFKAYDAIEQFQVIQDVIGRVQIKLVVKAQFRDDQVNLIKRGLDEFFARSITYDLHFVDEIPPDKSGKIKRIISRVRLQA